MAEEQESTGASQEGEKASEPSGTEAVRETAEGAARTPGGAGLWLGGGALLIALAAAGAGGYGYWHLQQRLGQVSEELTQTEQGQQAAQETVAELGDKLEGVRGQVQSVQDDQESLADRMAGVDDRLGSLQKATKDLKARLEGGPTYWRLERVESLLLAADRIVRLEGDAQSAHAALAEADRMLRQLSDPAWLDVREAIQKAMTRLEQVPDIDVPGIAFRLASLGESAMQLPLRGRQVLSAEAEKEGEEGTAAPPEDLWGRIKVGLGEFWSDVKGLVRLRRSEADAEPLLPPDRAAFLRHNLLLNLQAARLALLQDRPEVYRQSLASAREWVQRYFDEDSEAVNAMIGSLQKLEDRDITADPPRLEEPLRELRRVREERQN